MKEHTAPYLGILLGRYHILQVEIQDAQHFLVAPHMQFALELPGEMALNEHAHHPDDSENVVGVGVGYVDVVDVTAIDACPLQLRQHTIAATRVDEQLVGAIVHHKTSVVAAGYEGVAGP